MAENGELNSIRQCFVLEGNVLFSLNETKIWHIESMKLTMLREFYWELTKCSHFKKRSSTAIAIDVSIHILITQLSFRGDENVFIIPEHLISVFIFSSQFFVRFSQLWVVFPELFVPLFEWTSRLDPLYPCAWQTKLLSASSQFATQRYFHVP